MRRCRPSGPSSGDAQRGQECETKDVPDQLGEENRPRSICPNRGPRNITTALRLVDDIDEEIKGIERELRALGAHHPYVSLLQSVPGVAWIPDENNTWVLIGTNHQGGSRAPCWTLEAIER
jgi:hypothetical protein